MPLFNPCSPCCTPKPITFINRGHLIAFYQNAGFETLYHSGTFLGLPPILNDILFIEAIHLSSYHYEQIRDWFNTGGKRIVVITEAVQTLLGPYGAFPPTGAQAGSLNLFAASVGSGIVVDEDEANILYSGFGCLAGTFNSHYLTDGLTEFQHSNGIWDCSCFPDPYYSKMKWGIINHLSVGSGTMLVNYLGGYSVAVEKVGDSEIVSIGDFYGTAGGTYSQVGPYEHGCGGTETGCGGNITYGCCFNTPQFLLNLAMMPIQ